MYMLALLSMPSLPLLTPVTLPPFRYISLAELMASSDVLTAFTVPPLIVIDPYASIASWLFALAVISPPVMVMFPSLLMALGEAVALLLYLY